MAIRFVENYINIKLRIIIFSLMFFLFQGCKKDNFIQIITKEDTIVITKESLDFKKEDIKIALHNSITKPKILGEISKTDTSYIFKPLVRFTKGLSYDVFIKGNFIETIRIEKNKVVNKKTGLSIYPSKDTLPENLLKVYLEFTEPMKEVNNSLKYITVKNMTKDSVVDVFLKLSPELWNRDHSRLTLWLDPGRVKTDLIPNKMLGLPIRKGNRYSIEVSNEWEDLKGSSIEFYRKEFYVSDRDNSSPFVKDWDVEEPKLNTTDTLKIDFKESMDAILAKENIFINDNRGKRVEGLVFLTLNESTFNFVPEIKWSKGKYFIHVDSKLEDLAGNNLERLFDVDNTVKNEPQKNNLNKIEFEIY